MADELKLEPRTSSTKSVINVSRERIRKSQFTSFRMKCHLHVELDMPMATLEKSALFKLIVEK